MQIYFSTAAMEFQVPVLYHMCVGSGMVMSLPKPEKQYFKPGCIRAKDVQTKRDPHWESTHFGRHPSFLCIHFAGELVCRQAAMPV